MLKAEITPIMRKNWDNLEINDSSRYRPSVVDISSTVTVRGREAADRAILKPAYIAPIWSCQPPPVVSSKEINGKRWKQGWDVKAVGVMRREK